RDELVRVTTLEPRRIRRVREVVDDADVIAAREEAPDEMMSDEPHAAADEPTLHRGASTLRGTIRSAVRGDADALIAKAGLRDLRRTPDVARVDEDRREAVTGLDETLLDLREVRRAVAAPLGEEDERVRAVERVVVAIL